MKAREKWLSIWRPDSIWYRQIASHLPGVWESTDNEENNATTRLLCGWFYQPAYIPSTGPRFVAGSETFFIPFYFTSFCWWQDLQASNCKQTSNSGLQCQTEERVMKRPQSQDCWEIFSTFSRAFVLDVVQHRCEEGICAENCRPATTLLFLSVCWVISQRSNKKPGFSFFCLSLIPSISCCKSASSRGKAILQKHSA